MYPGLSQTKFGRVQSTPPLQLRRLHVPGPGPLREVEHQVPIPVLDQEDLIRQGVLTDELVPGASRADALGSCTCQAGTGHLAERWTAAGRSLTDLTLLGIPLSATDAAEDEKAAVLLYHQVTDQTGDPATEWPPADCGSSGYYVCAELERLGFASTYKTASGVLGALSLLQAGTVMQGLPWFRAWMQADSQGFIDGDGSPGALEAAVASGVAGGHETLQTGIPQLAVTASGVVDLANTVIRCRNSWSRNWNPSFEGEFLLHASTLDFLSTYCDFKQIAI